MKTVIKKITAFAFLALVLVSFKRYEETASYKCLIQMINYKGEGAYLVVSLMNAERDYEETLYVQGKDKEWYSEITEWWKFYGKRRPDIDAISGATISGGERTISVLKIPVDKIDKGYSIRFETAVEDQEYYTNDIQFELTTENLKKKMEGKGFIRYIRMLPQ
ncbi:DUF2271 domain-containing protein [Flavobacteriaceae bacterium R38]|nr:DUF2271 domain-containing protein [Flavobacteriaceae bacterium R38]